MITISVDELRHGRLPEAYYLAPYVLYRVRNGADVIYVGKTEQQSPQERLRQHLALDGDSDFFGQAAGPSALGHYIQQHAPDSNAWPIDLFTLADVQAWAGPNVRVETVAQAERLLIRRDGPRLNRANSTPSAQSASARSHSPRTLPEHAEAFLSDHTANQRTYDTYRYALLRWQAFGQAAGLTTSTQPLPVQRLSTESLGNFGSWLTAAGLKHNSVRTFLASIKQYLFWLQANGKLPAGVWAEDMLRGLERTAGPHLHRLPPQRRQADDSIGILLDYYAAQLPSVPADTPRGRRQRLACLRNQAIMQTLYSTAGRAGEVAALTLSQVQDALAAQPPEPTLLPVKITGRGDQERLIFLSP